MKMLKPKHCQRCQNIPWDTPTGTVVHTDSPQHAITLGDNAQLHYPATRKLSIPVDMDMVQDYLITKKLMQKKHFDKSHGGRPLSTLITSQKVLFLSPADQCSYVPSTFIETVSIPRSSLIKAQGKWYHRSREHIHPLQQDLFKVTNPQLQRTPKPTCIPKPNPLAKPRALSHPPNTFL